MMLPLTDCLLTNAWICCRHKLGSTLFYYETVLMWSLTSILHGKNCGHCSRAGGTSVCLSIWDNLYGVHDQSICQPVEVIYPLLNSCAAYRLLVSALSSSFRGKRVRSERAHTYACSSYCLRVHFSFPISLCVTWHQALIIGMMTRCHGELSQWPFWHFLLMKRCLLKILFIYPQYLKCCKCRFIHLSICQAV